MALPRDKPLVWLKGEVKSPPFSPPARLEAGLLLRRLQRGQVLGLPQSRPMQAIGAQCHELRIHDREQSWRIAYDLAAGRGRHPGDFQQENADDAIAGDRDV